MKNTYVKGKGGEGFTLSHQADENDDEIPTKRTTIRTVHMICCYLFCLCFLSYEISSKKKKGGELGETVAFYSTNCINHERRVFGFFFFL